MMSLPLPKAELHDLVSEYCMEWCGNPLNIPYLHKQIDHPKERDGNFDEFIDWATNS